jgi:hypothetical protein
MNCGDISRGPHRQGHGALMGIDVVENKNSFFPAPPPGEVSRQRWEIEVIA